MNQFDSYFEKLDEINEEVATETCCDISGNLCLYDGMTTCKVCSKVINNILEKHMLSVARLVRVFLIVFLLKIFYLCCKPLI